MKLLVDSGESLSNRATHGFFLAKKFFQGKLKREVFLTVYDPSLGKSVYGYFFICERCVLLSINRGLSDKAGIYLIEPSDNLEIVEDESKLGSIVNSNVRGERYLKVSTLNKICFIFLNKKYLILIGIQSSKVNYPNLVSGAYSVTYLTGKDYIQKVKNLITLIKNIVDRGEVRFDLKTHGLNPFLSLFNIYTGMFAYMAFIVFIIYFLINFFF
jgi:hypothetical protein